MYQIRRLYDWTMKWGDHPQSSIALSLLSCIESIFFPLPVDPLLVAMGVSRPKKSLWYAFLTTTFSVLGALGGYWIGATLWASTQDFFFQYVFSPEIFQVVTQKFNENAGLSIFLASFTPLPYKAFTISAGVANIPISTLVIFSILGRGGRFFLLGGLIYFFGAAIKDFIDKHFNTLVIATSILLVGGYFLIPKLLGS